MKLWPDSVYWFHIWQRLTVLHVLPIHSFDGGGVLAQSQFFEDLISTFCNFEKRTDHGLICCLVIYGHVPWQFWRRIDHQN